MRLQCFASMISAFPCLVVLSLCLPAQNNTAVNLNGVDAYGTTAGVGNLVANSTWEAWIRIPTQPIGGGVVLARWGSYSHALAVDTTTGQIGVDMYSCYTHPCPQETSPPNTLPRDRWHHIALVYGPQSGPSCEAYVDGQLVAWCGPQGCTPGGSNETVLGAWGFVGYSNFLHATVDEARISNIPRYSAPFVPQRTFVADANTVGLWHFDEATGNVAYDSSGHDRHFALHGGYSWVAGNNGVLAANASPYGVGCGTPPLSLAEDPAARPVIGLTAGATISNCPTPLVLVAMGWSDTMTGGIPLPMPLGAYGAPGCDLLQSLDFGGFWWATQNTGPGTAYFAFPVPNLPYLVGVDIHVQSWAVSPGTNSAGLIVSNGLRWTFGDY